MGEDENRYFSKSKDETIRAGKLTELLGQKGRYVLILDDLWENISLEQIGIPEPSGGSKLVITTRLKSICHYLDCQLVQMPILPKEDATNLFLQKGGQDIMLDPEISTVTESVIEQCAGLPLAIVTVASSMKGVRNIHEWRNALNELTRRTKSVTKLDEKILQQLQFSYDHLEDDTVKQCFLYCALYPEDHSISTNELIGLWIEEGLVEEQDSMQDEVDKGQTILNKLINNCLLETIVQDYGSFVKLHDLVRDMALHITSVKPRFMVKAGMLLEEMPAVQQWAEDLDKVSLLKNRRMQIPQIMQPPKCQKLKTLLLSECNIVNIPECFFEQMRGLKILDLSRNRLLKSLPRSISKLVSLTTLALVECYCLVNVPSLSKLKALKTLNIEHTRIESLPDGMKRLVNLKYLNLSNTKITEVPDGIISRFSCLQQLLTIRTYDEEGGAFVRGNEIGGLRKLEYFKGRFYILKELSGYVELQPLHDRTPRSYRRREYYIWVGPYTFFNESDIIYKKFIELSHLDLCENAPKLPSDVEQLNILETHIGELSSSELPAFSLFVPMLQSKFSSLKKIFITHCSNIKKLFSFDCVLQNLQNLLDLTVISCKEIEEIIIASELESEEKGMHSIRTIQKFALPNLRQLRLWNLPKLKSICSANAIMVCDSLERIIVENCPCLKRIPLYLPLIENGQPSPRASLQIIKMVSNDLLERNK